MTESERYQAGDRIADKYELVRKLDQGGMGAVWAARNADLDVHVALKLLRPELSETHAVDRLLAEARMLARLQHPAVVRVHDCGRTGQGDPFVVMELLDGESLADHMDRRGRISAVDAVSLLLPIVDGVRVAHEAGIVHRDIKPENIYLAQVGGRTQPKLLDFGIALAEAIAVRRTTHGAVMGSPVYMSPEQARGAEVGVSTDLWALAVVLFEMVSAALPFQGDNYNAVLRAIIEDEPASLTEVAAGDELLAAIVERGLAKDPARRWASARDLGTALAEWLVSQGLSEDASHTSLRSWLTRSSDPPMSLSPVMVGRSDRPPAEGRTGVVTTDGRRSVGAFTHTSVERNRRGRRVWVMSALAGVVLLVGGALWLRSAQSVRAVTSATGTDPPPVPLAAGDAGVDAKKAAVPALPEPKSDSPKPERRRDARPAPRSTKPSNAYRPRGI